MGAFLIDSSTTGGRMNPKVSRRYAEYITRVSALGGGPQKNTAKQSLLDASHRGLGGPESKRLAMVVLPQRPTPTRAHS